MASPAKWLRRLHRLRRLRQRADSVVIHDPLLKRPIPRGLLLWALCGHARRRFSLPEELTIVVAHDYPEESLMERSVRYVTGRPCAVARIAPADRWRFTRKVTALRDFLAGAPRTEYVLFSDANDCVLRDDPRRAIDLLTAYACDLLFSSSHAVEQYAYMPEVKEWVDTTLPGPSRGGRYLNSGCFVGRWGFVQEVVEAACDFIYEPGDPVAPRATAWKKRGEIRATECHPWGVELDQDLYRYLQPRFHPRLRVDPDWKLALRSNGGRL
jgi:hypothetical protein